MDEVRAYWQGVATSLALALRAQIWLEDHANTAIGAPGWVPEADRCLPCCRYAGAVIRGENPANVEGLRCEKARLQSHVLRTGHELAADVVEGMTAHDQPEGAQR